METLQNIFDRVSVRQFSDREITDAEVRTILTAGMSGPTAVNARPWSFIAVRDPELLGKMADASGGPAEPLRHAKLGILVCGDLERAFPKAPDFWIVDATIAAQNMVLAANDLGIGSVWLGTWPVEAKVKAQAELFGLPDTQIPHSIIAFGYPQQPSTKEKLLYEEDRVHFDKW